MSGPIHSFLATNIDFVSIVTLVVSFLSIIFGTVSVFFAYRTRKRYRINTRTLINVRDQAIKQNLLASIPRDNREEFYFLINNAFQKGDKTFPPSPVKAG